MARLEMVMKGMIAAREGRPGAEAPNIAMILS